MFGSRLSLPACLALVSLVALVPGLAHAGVPECGGARIEADAACELELSLTCEGSCDADAVLNKCAADLAAACSGGCSLTADVACNDNCGATCEQRCTEGDVVCHDGCWDECIPNCQTECGPGEPECRASCESTCDLECDSKCGELSLDASCNEHCNQCCLGMCTAVINFDCQIQCQAVDFSSCQQAFLDECEGSCDAGGALFCDGDFIASGGSLEACLDALADLGIDVEITTDIDTSGFCAIEPRRTNTTGNFALFTGLLLVGLGFGRRHRRR